MNAHKFVAEKGIEEAKRVLEGAHWENIAYSNGHYYSQSCSENDVNLEELKQVVESVDLIDSVQVLGRAGYQEVKSHLENCDPKWCHFHYKNWKNAIADYELVESYKQVTCEVLDMVDVSPNCEVINETH